MKQTLITILLALISMTGLAKDIVWENPTTEYGNAYGDGFFNLMLDVTKVELKADETVVYITAQEQQSAIERHLDVHSFPTYKLFDRNGNLLDLKVDPRELDNLARLLEQMK